MIDICDTVDRNPPYSDKNETILFIFDREWLCRSPRPRIVIFDNNNEFPRAFHVLLLLYEITPRQTTIKNAQANLFIERSHLVIANTLRVMDLQTLIYGEGSEHAILQLVAWGVRSTFHSTLNSTPGQLTFGRDIIINDMYITNWTYFCDRNIRSTLQNNTKENKNRTPHTYITCNQVFVSITDITRKLNSISGPYKVVQVYTNGTDTIRCSTNITERIKIRRIYQVF